MKKNLLLGLLLAGSAFHAQAFTEGFEDLAPDWTFINNGSPDINEQWGLWTSYFEMTPNTGNVMAGIQYSATYTHNDYMVSPQFQVIAGVSDKLSFYARNFGTNFQETISVLVSETDATAASFTGAIVADLPPTSGVWTKYEYDLTPYVGKQIYIAFHSKTFFKWFVGIDDVAVSGNTLAVNDNTKNKVSVYPNPFQDVITISDVKGVKSISISDASGRTIRKTEVQNQVNLENLKSGLYFINLHKEDGSVQTIKAIKK